MGMEGIGRGNSNIERLSNIQKGDVNKTGGKGTEWQLPSSTEMRKELESGRVKVNVGAIKQSIEQTKSNLSNDVRDDFKGAVNSSILAPLVLPESIVPAAQKIAKAYKNAKEEPSLGDVMSATIALIGMKVLPQDKQGGPNPSN